VPALVSLRERTPIAQGTRRVVYAHPDDPGLIIKVTRPDYLARRWTGTLSWRQKRRRYRHLLPFLLEIREHMAICAAWGSAPRHIQNLVGFANTDLGFGLVSEAARTASGAYAPTLHQIIMEGRFDERLATALETFRHDLLATPIVVTDLRPANIVCAEEPDGTPYFVLIDGIGEKTIVPINSFIGWLNRRYKERWVRDFEASLEDLLKASRATL
jgi:hypothetical protein